MSGDLPEEAPLVLRTTVSERYLGFSRFLTWASFAAIFAPSILGFVAGILGKATGILALNAVQGFLGDHVFTGVFWGGIFALSSALISGPTIRDWRGACDVIVDDDGLLFRRDALSHRVSRQSIRDAVVLSAPSTGVELWLANGNTLNLDLASEDEAYAVLAHLGFSPADRRVTVRLASPQRQLAAGCLALPFIWILLLLAFLGLWKLGLSSFALGTGYTFVPALLTLLLYRARRPPEVVVGTEGVLIRRPFGKNYFRYSELDSVSADGGALRFRKKGESQSRFTAARGDSTLVSAAVKRIADARALFGGREAEAAVSDLLELGGRDVAEWRAGLSTLAKQSGYRNASMTPEALCGVLENPETSPKRRIGAAMLLRIASPEARPRIRIAADACADEDLRAALAAAAEDEEIDDAKLERVLLAKP
jgi:hypothetical protein